MRHADQPATARMVSSARWWVVLMTFGMAGGAAVAGTLAAPGPAASGPSQAQEMRDWLLRIHEAASHRNFDGIFVVTMGGVASSARIAHYCQGAVQYERSEALDGEAREVYRRNDQVTTVWPARGMARVERRDQIAQFPALLRGGDDHIADHYEVRAGGEQRIAGRQADVLTLRPQDAWRYGWRLWADKASGLLLRADLLGPNDDVLESSAFSDVSIDVKARLASVVQPMNELNGYDVIRPTMVATQLGHEGWSMGEAVPGFREVSCVRRPSPGNAGNPGDPGSTDGAHTLQTIFSDGLTYVSVFVEPFASVPNPVTASLSMGPTQTLTLRRGDWWLTLIGDVPPATLQLFAHRLERMQK